ncbi:MAG: aldose 1-epimerase [Actinomycetota bacterium]|nr:aldose 1-epimerase [Actinomycetota bacterium]
MAARVHVQTQKDDVAVVLEAGDLAATFLPDAAMLGVSLRHQGVELLALPHSAAQWKQGSTTGMPLLHPWANRLGGRSYRVGDRQVRLAGVALPVDGNNLSIHGTVRNTAFSIDTLTARANAAVLSARLDSSTDALLTRAFPFPHELTVTAQLTARTLRVTTELRPTGPAAVPIAFGFHPYFRLPAARRAVSLRLPKRTELLLDSRNLPTGEEHECAAENKPLARRVFDTHYRLGADRRFVVAGGDRRLAVTFDAGYPHAQVYAPARSNFVCIEPMTAPVDGLRRGQVTMVPPRGTYRAGFTVRVA